MRRYFILFLLIFVSSAASANADVFTEALNQKSSLSPANSPFKNQEQFFKTKQFLGLVDFNKTLLLNIKKGEKYSSSRLSSARKTANEKIQANSIKLKSIASEGAVLIKKAAANEIERGSRAALLDYNKKSSQLRASYKKNLRIVSKKRNISYIKIKNSHLKKLKRAYSVSSQKKIRSSFKDKISKARRSYYLRVGSLRKSIEAKNKSIVSEMNSRYRSFYNKVKNEAKKSITALNKRTALQRKVLTKTKENTSRHLARLSRKNEVKTINVFEVKRTILPDVLPPYSAPEVGPVIGPWPDLSTPKRYLISSSYLPKNIVSFQKKQSARFCKIGSYYKSLKKSVADFSRKLPGIKKSVSSNTSATKSAQRKYNKARVYYTQKKADYKKEKKKRLERPDDSWYKRAKNRYLEAKAALADAEGDLSYAKMKLSYQRDLLSGTIKAIKDRSKKMSYYRSEQKVLSRKYGIKGKRCPSAVIR